jgi:hypothetical protein
VGSEMCIRDRFWRADGRTEVVLIEHGQKNLNGRGLSNYPVFMGPEILGELSSVPL